MSTPGTSIKQQARELIERLPDEATWDEVAYRIEVRASIERGLADADAGAMVSVEEILKEFDLTP